MIIINLITNTNWKPDYDLNKGINETIDWIKNNINLYKPEFIMFDEVVEFNKSRYLKQISVSLHSPVSLGKVNKYPIDFIDSIYFSYVGKYITQSEEIVTQFNGTKYAVANGTAALQNAGVKYGDEVITQPLSLVPIANAISQYGAIPVFVDVDLDTMGISPEKLNDWLKKNNKPSKLSKCIKKVTAKPISAIVSMYTFSHPCRIEEIVEVAKKFRITFIEDAAESLGSYNKNKHAGSFGLA